LIVFLKLSNCMELTKRKVMNKFFLYVACLIAVIADMLFVCWAKKSSHSLAILFTATILNLIGTALWTYSLKAGIESATAITVYALFTIGGCSLLGYAIFNKHLTALNFVGLMLAVIALVMISV